jgi:hypothetical protein
MPFSKGRSGNVKGRPKGAKDHIPRTFRGLASQVLAANGADVQAALRKGINGKDAHRYLSILASLEKQHVELSGEVTMPAQVIFELHRNSA